MRNEQLDVKGKGVYVGGSATKELRRVARTSFGKFFKPQRRLI